MADGVATLRAEGITRFQLKVGDDPRLDADRVRAVLGRCGPDDIVIADANGRYTTQAGVVAARLLAPYVFGVTTHDAMTYASIIALLAAVSVLASWLPARRAGRVEPAVVLRGD